MKIMNGFFNRSQLLAATTLLVLSAGLSVPAAVRADDTEVFFPPVQVTGTTTASNPNVMFIIDTSGSMAGTDGFPNLPDGTPQTRIKRVQIAFAQLMAQLGPNINIGLMRFSSFQGGPVIFPVSPIDAPVSSVIGGTSLQNLSYTDNGVEASEAEENISSSSVSFPSNALRLGTDADRIYLQGNNQDEAEEWPNPSRSSSRGFVDAASSATGSRCSADLDLNYDNSSNYCTGRSVTPRAQIIGLRFPNIDIPADAKIAGAGLTVTDDGNNSNASSLNVDGEAAVNSASFSPCSSCGSVSGRATTSSAVQVPWNIPNSGTQGATFISPDLSGIVQQIITTSVGGTNWVKGNPVTLLISNSAAGSSNDRSVYGINGAISTDAQPKLGIAWGAGASGVGPNPLLTAVRFEHIQVPQGVTIKAATIEFHAAQIADSRPLTVNITAENADDSAGFVASSGNISSRPDTSAVSWAIDPWTTPGDSYSTPDISSALNSVVSRTGWCGDNDLTVKFTYVSGTGSRAAVTNAMDPTLAPILHLTLDPNDPKMNTGCQKSSFIQQVSASSDDANERVSSGSVTTTSSYNYLGNDTNNRAQELGLRFENVNIPKNATITDAYIDFTAQGSNT
ncbi:MAG: vWA domain-containing protein, partial [Stenotrophobium sp.]